MLDLDHDADTLGLELIEEPVRDPFGEPLPPSPNRSSSSNVSAVDMSCCPYLLGSQSLSTMKTVARPPATPITCNPYRPPVSSSALSMVVIHPGAGRPGSRTPRSGRSAAAHTALCLPDSENLRYIIAARRGCQLIIR
jgi:hypothetical protein